MNESGHRGWFRYYSPLDSACTYGVRHYRFNSGLMLILGLRQLYLSLPRLVGPTKFLQWAIR